MYVTAKKPGYKVQFKVYCPIQIFTIFEDNFQLFSYILCILKKKLGQWSLETFESAATKKHYLAKAKISFRFKQVFYYFI